MNHEAAYHLAIVCEAQADQMIGSDLADRVIIENAELHWIDKDNIDDYREWISFDSEHNYIKWGTLSKIVKKFQADNRFNLEITGKWKKFPHLKCARIMLAALKKNSSRKIDAVILLCDSDKKKLRLEGFEEARNSKPLEEKHDVSEPNHWPFEIIIGVAHPKRECWVLNGFSPKDKREETELENIKNEISFDPCKEAERLNDDKGNPRDAKRVLKKLTGGNFDRERECWSSSSLEELKMRGTKTGLTNYITELGDRLPRVFGAGLPTP